MKSKDLIGKWKIHREAYGSQGKVKGRMYGMGYFQAIQTHEYLYQEQLWHETDNQDFLFAKKFYRYLFIEKEVHIYFHQEENNRLFMILPLGDAMVGVSTCGEDHYTLHWDWVNTETFLTRYIVKGKKKNYIIESEFKR